MVFSEYMNNSTKSRTFFERTKDNKKIKRIIIVAFSKYINFRSVLVHPPKKRKKCKRKQDVICSVPPHMYALAPQNKIINASWTAVWIISLDLYLLLKNLRDKKNHPKILESLLNQESCQLLSKGAKSQIRWRRNFQ